jgi:hypothetical protein
VLVLAGVGLALDRHCRMPVMVTMAVVSFRAVVKPLAVVNFGAGIACFDGKIVIAGVLGMVGVVLGLGHGS